MCVCVRWANDGDITHMFLVRKVCVPRLIGFVLQTCVFVCRPGCSRVVDAGPERNGMYSASTL